jgi:hypothetical protein
MWREDVPIALIHAPIALIHAPIALGRERMDW